MVHSRLKCGKYFMGIMATTIEVPDILIAPISNQGFKFWGIKYLLTHVGTIFSFHGLVLTIHNLTQALHQDAVLIARKERVPMTAPHHFDDIPASASELAFKLLNNLAVTTNGTI